MQDKIITGVTL